MGPALLVTGDLNVDNQIGDLGGLSKNLVVKSMEWVVLRNKTPTGF